MTHCNVLNVLYVIFLGWEFIMQNIRKQVFCLALLFSIANIEFSYAIWGSKKQEKTTEATTEKEKIRADMSQYAEKFKKATSDVDYRVNTQYIEEKRKQIESYKNDINTYYDNHNEDLNEEFNKSLERYKESCKGGSCDLRRVFIDMYEKTHSILVYELKKKNEQIIIDEVSISNAADVNSAYEKSRDEKIKKLRQLVNYTNMISNLSDSIRQKIAAADNYLSNNIEITNTSTATLYSLKDEYATIMFLCGLPIANKQLEVLQQTTDFKQTKEIKVLQEKINANPKDLKVISEYYVFIKSLYENAVINVKNQLKEIAQNNPEISDIITCGRTSEDPLTYLTKLSQKARSATEGLEKEKQQVEASNCDDSKSAA